MNKISFRAFVAIAVVIGWMGLGASPALATVEGANPAEVQVGSERIGLDQNGALLTCGTGSWQSGNLEIHHINVGQGDSTLIVSPTGKSLLFDVGATSVGPYIEAVLGCKELDYVVISHFHEDHIGSVGSGGLWNLVEVQGFAVTTTLVRDYNHFVGNKNLDAWKAYLEGSGQAKLHPETAIEDSSQVDLGGGVVFDILTVDGNGMIIQGNFNGDANPPSENDYSVGALIRYGAFDEWLGGDLDGEFKDGYHDIEWSVAPEAGDVDVYRVNHHGSSHSNSHTFVDQLDPEVSIISVGDGNTYSHPTTEVMQYLVGTSVVYRTERGEPDTDVESVIVGGDIVIKTVDGLNYTVNYTLGGLGQTDNYSASEPARVDADGDGYFFEADPDDNDAIRVPARTGGCDPTYQTCLCKVTAGQVLVNEVLPAPSTGNPEWAELYNPTNLTVNIEYCYIDDEVGGKPPLQIPSGTYISRNGFWSTDDLSSFFNNDGDDVRLLKEDKTSILDSFTFGATASNESWHRTPDGGAWAVTTTNSPTRNAPNNPIIRVVLRSQKSNDGWILESNETSNTGGAMNNSAPTFYIGDGTADKQYRSIISFNATLPANAVITKSILKIKASGTLVGDNDPFSWGNRLRADVCKGTFGSAPLQLGDFNFNNTVNCKLLAGAFNSVPISGWYNANITSAAWDKINTVGLTQFRLRFAKDDNDDGAADYWRFFSGDYATASARPTLIIEYYVP